MCLLVRHFPEVLSGLIRAHLNFFNLWLKNLQIENLQSLYFDLPGAKSFRKRFIKKGFLKNASFIICWNVLMAFFFAFSFFSGLFSPLIALFTISSYSLEMPFRFFPIIPLYAAFFFPV